MNKQCRNILTSKRCSPAAEAIYPDICWLTQKMAIYSNKPTIAYSQALIKIAKIMNDDVDAIIMFLISAATFSASTSVALNVALPHS